MCEMDFCRIENKYFIAEDKVPSFLADLNDRLDLDPYAKATGYYQVNTIYFDNGHHDIIFRSLSSPLYKCKLRLRSYGGPKPLFFLEFKKKYGCDVYKTRIFLNEEEVNLLVKKGVLPAKNGDWKHDRFISELQDMVRRYANIEPAELIQYRRAAFMNKPGEDYLRLTIDSNILVRRDNFQINEPGGEPLLPDGKLLIEAKIGRALPLWLASSLTEAEAFRGAYSKYGASYGEYAKKKLSSGLPAAGSNLVYSPANASDFVPSYH